MSGGEAPGWGEVVAFLSDAASHGLPEADAVQRIDTQISAVFLAGPRAYKLARPIRLSFCDFSTPERRREALLREFELNRIAAPDLYLGVSDIIWDGRHFTIGSRGEAVEPCLVMRRFDQGERFDRLLAAGALDREVMEELAVAIHRFHDAQTPDLRWGYGGADGMAKILADNRIEAARYPESLSPGPLRALEDKLADELERQAPLLDARKQAGLVRHCHGDLHLGNIVRFQGRATLFDAIAFNEHLAVVDLLYDLAFLLMDLEVRGRRDLAGAVMNRYLQIGGALEGLELLPLFLALRAHIRAFVAAAGAAATPDEAACREGQEAARNYLQAATAFLQPSPASLLAVGGLSGSGKTTVARGLAPLLGRAPGALILRSDVIRKSLFGRAPEESLPEEAYRPEVSADIYRRMREEAAIALKAGQAVILDAVHARPAERAALRDLAGRAGVPFLGLWLEAPVEAMKERVEARRDDASDATARVVEAQLSYDLGRIDWVRIDAVGTPEAVIARAAALLGMPQG